MKNSTVEKSQKTAIIRLTIDLVVNVPDEQANEDSLHDIVNELEYNFKDTTGNAVINDSTMTDSEIVEIS